ncbi:MAG TPA: four helix bundle protein [Acidobacteriota bacterium]|nr:four helix bundle protein [Acidobacteriota bacterium]
MRDGTSVSSATVTSYRDLRVWQLGVDLAQEIYLLTRSFPKQEVYGLSSQLQKSAISISSNIAEGHTRESSNEFLHFLSIAQASLSELETQLEIAARLRYLPSSKLEDVYGKTSALGRQLYALRNALRRRSSP